MPSQLAAFGGAFEYEHRHRTPQRGHEGGLFYNLLAVRLPAYRPPRAGRNAFKRLVARPAPGSCPVHI